MTTAETFEKVKLVPVRPTALAHHRELPPGRYLARSLTGKIYCLARQDEPLILYLVEWMGERRMIREFRVTESGEVEKIPL